MTRTFAFDASDKAESELGLVLIDSDEGGRYGLTIGVRAQ